MRTRRSIVDVPIEFKPNGKAKPTAVAWPETVVGPNQQLVFSVGFDTDVPAGTHITMQLGYQAGGTVRTGGPQS